MGAETLHPTIPNDQIHPPRDFPDAAVNDILVKDEQSSIRWERRNILPRAISFVDGDDAPPTENDNDVYVIIDATSVEAGWDGASNNDWVRFDFENDTWFSITPQAGYLVYNENISKYKLYNGTDWVDLVGVTAPAPRVGTVAITKSQTQVNFTSDLASANYQVFITDSDGVGWKKITDKQVGGFKITGLSVGTISFQAILNN